MAPEAIYSEKDFKVFLQGSYGNETNIYAESDVDVVVRLDSIFNYNISDLPSDQSAEFSRVYAGGANYTFDEFNNAVGTRLATAFGKDSSFGTKAYRIKANGSRRNADVVTCNQYRHYKRFFSPSNCEFVEGIVFPTTSVGRIVNYPLVHSKNCTDKHQGTNPGFKRIVRIFKNMRTKLVESNMIAEDVAPSYYIEGLIYNVPNDKFERDYTTTVCNCINWLYQADRTQFVCANRQHRLLGNSNVQWTEAKCDAFLNALISLWNKW
jgi:hypothetical protein